MGVGQALLIAEEAAELGALGAVVRSTEPEFARPYYLVHRKQSLSAEAQAFIDIALRLARDFAIDDREAGSSTRTHLRRSGARTSEPAPSGLPGAD